MQIHQRPRLDFDRKSGSQWHFLLDITVSQIQVFETVIFLVSCIRVLTFSLLFLCCSPTLAQCSPPTARSNKDGAKGLLRELNPGPLAPEARIMPLDQAAVLHMRSIWVFPWRLSAAYSCVHFTLRAARCAAATGPAWQSCRNGRAVAQRKVTPAGLEPAIPGSVGRCLIHWATGPIEHIVSSTHIFVQSVTVSIAGLCECFVAVPRTQQHACASQVAPAVHGTVWRVFGGHLTN